MIRKLRTSFLLSGELRETISKYVKVIDQADVSEPVIGKITGLLKEDVNDFALALAKLNTNSMTGLTQDTDLVRDELLMALRLLIEAGDKMQDDDAQKAYDLVFPVIDKTGLRTIRYGYAEKSSRLAALFTKLDEPDYQGALATLNATAVYTKLKAAESEFLRVYELRVNEEATDIGFRLRDVRLRTTPRLTTLLGLLEILVELEPEAYGTLVEKINVITTEAMAVARARRTRIENGLSEDESNEEVPDGDKPVSDDADQPMAIDSI